jgi:hypothetical protein
MAKRKADNGYNGQKKGKQKRQILVDLTMATVGR